MAKRSSLRFLVFIGIFALCVPTASIAAGSPDLVQNPGVKSPVSTPVLTEAPTGNTTWAGQPIETAKKNATKGYFLADYYRNSSTEPLTTITLKGNGFGQYGEIVISDIGLSAEIASWSDSTIKFVLRTRSWTYAFNPSVTFSVINDKGNISAPSVARGVAGMIQTRPWGQCTWEVAKARLDNNFTIPLQLAYSGTEIDKTWVPAIWDAITFEKGGGSSDGHVGIISTEPEYADKFSGPDKNGKKTLESRTYTFTIHDRNRRWDEEVGTADVSVRVDYGADGKPSAIDLSSFKVAYPARKFFRGTRLGTPTSNKQVAEIPGSLVYETCFQMECFKEHLVSKTRNKDGRIFAFVAVKNFFNERGYNKNDYKDLHAELNSLPIKYVTYILSCEALGGYIEYPGGKRIAEPERNAPRATEGAYKMWSAVCGQV